MVSENEVNSNNMDDPEASLEEFTDLARASCGWAGIHQRGPPGEGGFGGSIGKCLTVPYLCIYFNIFRKMQLIKSVISQIFLT